MTVAIFFALLAPIAGAIFGKNGVIAVGVAGGICLAGGWSGLLLAALLAALLRGLNPGYGMLVGMLPRMGLPLLLAVLIYREAKWLVEAGFIYYLLVFYLVTLAVEAWVAATRSNPSGSAAGNT